MWFPVSVIRRQNLFCISSSFHLLNEFWGNYIQENRAAHCSGFRYVAVGHKKLPTKQCKQKVTPNGECHHLRIYQWNIHPVVQRQTSNGRPVALDTLKPSKSDLSAVHLPSTFGRIT